MTISAKANNANIDAASANLVIQVDLVVLSIGQLLWCIARRTVQLNRKTRRLPCHVLIRHYANAAVVGRMFGALLVCVAPLGPETVEGAKGCPYRENP